MLRLKFCCLTNRCFNEGLKRGFEQTYKLCPAISAACEYNTSFKAFLTFKQHQSPVLHLQRSKGLFLSFEVQKPMNCIISPEENYKSINFLTFGWLCYVKATPTFMLLLCYFLNSRKLVLFFSLYQCNIYKSSEEAVCYMMPRNRLEAWSH